VEIVNLAPSGAHPELEDGRLAFISWVKGAFTEGFRQGSRSARPMFSTVREAHDEGAIVVENLTQTLLRCNGIVRACGETRKKQ